MKQLNKMQLMTDAISKGLDVAVSLLTAAKQKAGVDRQEGHWWRIYQSVRNRLSPVTRSLDFLALNTRIRFLTK
jgi:hypothetical protein